MNKQKYDEARKKNAELNDGNIWARNAPWGRTHTYSRSPEIYTKSRFEEHTDDVTWRWPLFTAHSLPTLCLGRRSESKSVHIKLEAIRSFEKNFFKKRERGKGRKRLIDISEQIYLDDKKKQRCERMMIKKKKYEWK